MSFMLIPQIDIRKLLFHFAKLIIVPPIDKTNPGQFIIDSPPRITQRKPSRTPTIGFKEYKRRYFSGTILLLPLRTNSRETPTTKEYSKSDAKRFDSNVCVAHRTTLSASVTA